PYKAQPGRARSAAVAVTTTRISRNEHRRALVKSCLSAVILVLFASIPVFAAAPESSPATPPHWPAKGFAPYAYIPKNFINITNCLAVTGQKYYTLAFIISDREGFPAWDGSSDLRIGTKYYASQVQALRAAGGDVLISFGGEAGTEIAINTT